MPISIRIHGVKTLNKVKSFPKGQWVMIQLYKEITVNEVIKSFMDHWMYNSKLSGDSFGSVKAAIKELITKEYGKDLQALPFKKKDCKGKYLYLDVE